MSLGRNYGKYIVVDIISAALAWLSFFMFRKLIIEESAVHAVLFNTELFLGLAIIPIYWVVIYYLSGSYRYLDRRIVIESAGITFLTTLIGVTGLFFTLLLDDKITSYKIYYVSTTSLFLIHYVFTVTPRIVFSKLNKKAIRTGKLKFNTIIIGSGVKAVHIFNELNSNQQQFGNHFIGYVMPPSAEKNMLAEHIPCLGALKDLPELIQKHAVKEIIIAIQAGDHNEINEILNWLGYSEITVKAIAELNHTLKGKAKITNIFGTPLLEINYELLPVWQATLKQCIDLALSALAILLLSPAYIVCAIAIKLTSRGPILFRQERIGKNGKPFTLYKFRSMRIDAEKDGPNLAKENDTRRTPFGVFLRNTKLDEIPNFFNVLLGDMALVGPRPERQYYIDQIVKISPNYLQLQKIKPGITSLGQVKFGYACDVEQMTKRLRYDLLYLENMSLYTDFLVVYYTVMLLFKGRHV